MYHTKLDKSTLLGWFIAKDSSRMLHSIIQAFLNHHHLQCEDYNARAAKGMPTILTFCNPHHLESLDSCKDNELRAFA